MVRLERQHAAALWSNPRPVCMDTLWLGYHGLDLPFDEIVAVLRYQPILDSQIVRTYGRVPHGVQSVVVTVAGAYLPARLPVETLRRRWAGWRRDGP